MLTMVLSRMTINWAIPSTARIHHRMVWLDSLAVGAAADSACGEVVVLMERLRTLKWSQDLRLRDYYTGMWRNVLHFFGNIWRSRVMRIDGCCH